ncbi:hypothetical protein PE024_002798 [Escherichia coli]|nr:hypothetical protein [Escherichia coli]
MNYAGHEKLRAEVAEVANVMCDLRTTMNELERRYSFNADTLPERRKRKLTAVCSHQTRIGNLDAHLI